MRAPSPITLVVYDEHLMCLEGLAAAFDGDPTVAVVATTTERELLGDIVEERRPSVCLFDVGAADASSVTAIARVIGRSPSTAVVVLVDEPSSAFVRSAVKAGVRGFIRKDAGLRSLRQTIDRVGASRAVVGADAARRHTTSSVRAARPVSAAPTLDWLTSREQEVLDHILAGENTRNIAAALQISRSTARTHVQNVRRKLGARNKLQVVALALGTTPKWQPTAPYPIRSVS
jgi:DNA-binding NarL/FixJ family response regulator